MKKLEKDSLDENYVHFKCGSYFLRTAMCGNLIGQTIAPVYVGLNGCVHFNGVDNTEILLVFEI